MNNSQKNACHTFTNSTDKCCLFLYYRTPWQALFFSSKKLPHRYTSQRLPVAFQSVYLNEPHALDRPVSCEILRNYYCTAVHTTVVGGHGMWSLRLHLMAIPRIWLRYFDAFEESVGFLDMSIPTRLAGKPVKKDGEGGVGWGGGEKYTRFACLSRGTIEANPWLRPP